MSDESDQHTCPEGTALGDHGILRMNPLPFEESFRE
jgi:hypothetical protein